MINRNLQNHLQYLELILNDKTGWHSTTYGINGPSILSNLKHFDITMCLPFDIMHSIFEGITVVHLNLLFCYLCDDLVCINLEQLNHIIKSHPYGYSEVDTKPTVIDRESSTSSFHFKQSGMLLLLMLLHKIFCFAIVSCCCLILTSSILVVSLSLYTLESLYRLYCQRYVLWLLVYVELLIY